MTYQPYLFVNGAWKRTTFSERGRHPIKDEVDICALSIAQAEWSMAFTTVAERSQRATNWPYPQKCFDYAPSCCSSLYAIHTAKSVRVFENLKQEEKQLCWYTRGFPKFDWMVFPLTRYIWMQVIAEWSANGSSCSKWVNLTLRTCLQTSQHLSSSIHSLIMKNVAKAIDPVLPAVTATKYCMSNVQRIESKSFEHLAVTSTASTGTFHPCQTKRCQTTRMVWVSHYCWALLR